MSAAPKLKQDRHHSVDADLADRIFRLHLSGLSLLPLGRGDAGKEATRSYKDRTFSAGAVLAAMEADMYGIRLADMVVVDIDTDTAEARDYVRHRFGESTVQVSTSRGTHHYFAHDGQAKPAEIRQPNIAIDIKTGINAYVVGPGSIRPDTGVVYTEIVGELGLTDLPVFRDREDATEIGDGAISGKIAKGQRNKALFNDLMRMSLGYEDYAEFEINALLKRDWLLDQTEETFTDAETKRLARHVWNDYRVKGRVFTGSNSEFRFNRMWFDKLENVENGENAAMLLLYLVKNHGHTGRDRFVIVPDAINKHGHLRCLKRCSFYTAIRLLVSEGILGRQTFRGKRPNEYWFTGSVA